MCHEGKSCAMRASHVPCVRRFVWGVDACTGRASQPHAKRASQPHAKRASQPHLREGSTDGAHALCQVQAPHMPHTSPTHARYKPHTEEQVRLSKWSLEKLGSILESPSAMSWHQRWVQVSRAGAEWRQSGSWAWGLWHVLPRGMQNVCAASRDELCVCVCVVHNACVWY